MKRAKKGLTLWMMGGVGVIIIICLFVAIRALYSTSEGFADLHPQATKQLIANLTTLNSSATQYNTKVMNNLKIIDQMYEKVQSANTGIDDIKDIKKVANVKFVASQANLDSANMLLTKLDGYLIRNWESSIASSNSTAQGLVSSIKDKVISVNNAVTVMKGKNEYIQSRKLR